LAEAVAGVVGDEARRIGDEEARHRIERLARVTGS
jgi:hypothetical protein